jgi:tetratricopeptide (TPR) repeat protein
MNDVTTTPVRLQTTPDMMQQTSEAPPPTSFMWRSLKQVLYLLLMGIIGVVLGIVVLYLPGPLIPPTSYLGAVAGVMLCLYLVVALHELGHAAGGKLAGYHLIFLSVGPLRLGREIGGWKVRLMPSRILKFGGWAYGVPTRRDGWRWRRLLFIAAGPVASLLLLLALLALRLAWRDMAVFPPFALMTHFMTFAALAVLPFSFIPLTISGLRNDALLFVDTLRAGGEKARRQQALSWLIAEAMRGKRSRETDTAVLAEVLYPSDNSHEELIASIWSYYYEMDWQRPQQAAAHLDRAFAILREEPQPALLSICAMDAAFFEARHGRRPDTAAAWMDLVDLSKASHPTGGVELEVMHHRSQAAVFWAKGEIEAAREEARQGLELLPRLVDQGGVQIEREWLEQLAAGHLNN